MSNHVNNNVSTAELVDNLFKTHKRSDNREFTYQEIANALDRQLDASYIAKVRKGVIKNPGRDALKLLCQFFRVPSSYFFPELDMLSADESAERDEKQALRVVLRSAGLSAEAQAHVEGLIEMLRPKK
jgi:transcriptional regulator with XRE-family HTH domain